MVREIARTAATALAILGHAYAEGQREQAVRDAIARQQEFEA
jgi:hypothetical protein